MKLRIQDMSKATGVMLSVFTVVTLLIHPLDPLLQRATFVFLSTVMAFLKVLDQKKDAKVWYKSYLVLLILLSAGSWLYTAFNYEGIIERAGLYPEISDLVSGIVLLAVLLEMARMTMGISLPFLSLLMVLYGMYGHSLPGLFAHAGFSLEREISYIYSLDGIFGSPLAVTITYVFIFSMFGAFMEYTGGGEAIRELSMVVAGKARGGAAKVAIVASALFGSINGSPVANVTATGTFTIPLMKKNGYNSEFAGAVTAVASTGGQILPPVMGASVFIMIEILGVPYSTVAFAAVVPAILYYLAVFWMVDLEAQKTGLQGVSSEELPPARKVLREKGPALFPIVALIVPLLVFQISPLRAGMIGSIAAVICSFARKETRITIKSFFDALYETARGTIMVTAAVTLAGVIVGIVGITGLGLNMTNILLSYSGGKLLLTCVFGMVALIILGIGMPTTGAYIIGATIIAPAMLKLGVLPLAAHLFVLYFANISNITPPVALASYAAAGIADTSPMKVGLESFRLGILGFVIPYVMVYENGLMLIGSFSTIAFTIGTCVLGILAIGIALQGYMWGRLNIFVRVIVFAASIMLILPCGYVITAAALAVIGGALYFARMQGKKALATQGAGTER
ncbi:TRAP transporter permease [Cloacibacillus evryensis]|uniref:TRAP transporter permease n=1 Tax=Cloacibacillus evryensis TaxID=508460 RepID=UPI00241D4FAC|nr:TRAP transporter fused permease subunit [Cloacibacillus evryensis]